MFDVYDVADEFLAIESMTQKNYKNYAIMLKDGMQE